MKAIMIFTVELAVRYQETFWELWLACIEVCIHLPYIIMKLLAHISEVACLSLCSCWADALYLCRRFLQKSDVSSKQNVFACKRVCPSYQMVRFSTRACSFPLFTPLPFHLRITVFCKQNLIVKKKSCYFYPYVNEELLKAH